MKKLLIYLVVLFIIITGIVYFSTKVENKNYGAIQTKYLSEKVEMTNSNTIKFNLIGTDSNNITCSLKLSDITIIVGTTEVPQSSLGDIALGTITYPQTNKATCQLTLKGVPGEGQLKIKIAANTLTDNAGNKNTETTLATEVTMCLPNAKIVAANPDTYYGKTVRYSANGVMDWKVFYADSNNMFLITSDYLPIGKVPTAATGMTTTGTYQAYWASVPSEQTVTNLSSSFMFTGFDYVEGTGTRCARTLLNTNNWANFVNTMYADYSIGSPTLEMWLGSFYSKYPPEEFTIGTTRFGYWLSSNGGSSIAPWPNPSSVEGRKDTLYFVHVGEYEGCRGYRLSSPSWDCYGGNAWEGILEIYDNALHRHQYYNDSLGLRPVVRLKDGCKLTTENAGSCDFGLVQ